MGSSFFYSSRLGSNCPASWFFLIRPGYGAVSERALETAGMMFFAGFIHVSLYVSQKNIMKVIMNSVKMIGIYNSSNFWIFWLGGICSRHLNWLFCPFGHVTLLRGLSMTMRFVSLGTRPMRGSSSEIWRSSTASPNPSAGPVSI
jgi:hypothetical protein